MQKIAIIGAGRLGGALAIAITRAGGEVSLVIFRGSVSTELRANLNKQTQLVDREYCASIDAEVILIAVQDQEIGSVAPWLGGRVKAGAVVVHTSGSLSSEILTPLRDASGCAIGSMHPLVSVSSVSDGAASFSGTYFCIEGDPAARDAATSIAAMLGATPFSIDTKFKPLYHAAAVTASGHFTALVDAAIEMLSKCGMTAADARVVLLPLIASTLKNLNDKMPEDALTGTYARGDVNGVDRHLDALASGGVAGSARDLYLAAAIRSLEIVARRVDPPAELDSIRDRISVAKRLGE